ncbi:MAG: hypothetical protein QM477_08830 [Planctomycetota bacterium]
MNHPQLFVCSLLLFGSCQIAQREAQSLGNPLGTIVANQDWALNMEFGQERVTGTGKGGQFLFWKTGDRKLANGVVGTSTDFGLIPDIDDLRLGELRSAAVYDAITKANCEVLAYPIFSWEGTSSPFSVDYVVHVKGFPGWVKGIQAIPRVNVSGVNYLPGSHQAGEPRRPSPTWIAHVFAGDPSQRQESKNGSSPPPSSWSNWDEPSTQN